MLRKKKGVTMPLAKDYLGDSVYAQINEYGQIVLTTENGLPTDPSNIIYLEPEVYEALVRYNMAAQKYKDVHNV